MTFNKDKCKFGVKEVKYVGNVLTPEGMKPDPKKTEAIEKMPRPSSKKEIQTFIGMVNYVGRYITNLSAKTAPLREVLNKEVEFHWGQKQEEAFEDLKKMIVSAPTLAFYDVKKPVTLQTDASQNGLGAVIMQGGKPVAFASKALTAAQRNYAQIEKEMAAIAFGAERFHQYLFGKEVLVETDHKPLEAICKKPLTTAPPRLQRFLLQVQKYDLKVVHKPGKEMFISDALSRAYLPESESESTTEKEAEIEVAMLISNLPMSQKKIEEIRELMANDDEMIVLKNYVLSGWPETREEVDRVKDYWNFREEIFYTDGLLFKRDKMIIPKKMRSYMLGRIHGAHLGVEKCKLRARDVLYWPRMGEDIELHVQSCNTCKTFRHQQRKEPMINHEIPSRAWEKVGTDLFQYGRRQYVLVVDYYSKFVDVRLLEDTSSSTTIKQLKSIFSVHGIPETVISDNDPQYSSKEFKKFSREWEFQHVTSSPRYPQSNGLAERSVQTVKSVLRKAEHSGQDPYLGLLELRNTPVDEQLGSPSQLLFGRRTQSVLPVHPSLLQGDTHKSSQDISDQLKKRQSSQKRWYDRSSHGMKSLIPGDTVRIKEDKVWNPAVVVEKCQEPRSYIVDTGASKLRRNRRDLIKVRSERPLQTPVMEGESRRSKPELANNPVRSPAKSQERRAPLPQMTRSGRAVRPPVHLKDYV